MENRQVYFFKINYGKWSYKKVKSWKGFPRGKAFEFSYNFNEHHNYFLDASVHSIRGFIIDMEKYKGDFEEVYQQYGISKKFLESIRKPIKREERFKKLLND